MKQALARPPARFVLLAAVLMALLDVACPGSLPDDPQGGAGSNGGGGTGGTGPAPCDAFTTILSTQRCSMTSCHGADQTQGVELQSPGVVARLLNIKSTSATCGSDTTPYLVPNSNPAAGLLIDKFLAVPPCGLVMPYAGFGGEINPTEMSCIMDWATAVTIGRITQ